MRIIEPELLWRRGGFHTGLQVEIRDDGTFGNVGKALDRAPERLEGEALLPGMVNAHSHAFQRGLRGKADRFGEGWGNFWSWREAMYRLVDELDAERFERLSRLAFWEMLRSGITTVGEFHYVHHLRQSQGYELDDSLVAAASASGIRLMLLDVLYLTGDVERPLEGAQARFGSASVGDFLRSAERLEGALDPGTQRLGLVAHSIRAVPLDAVSELHAEAKRSGRVFHMHVEEQRLEIESAVSYYGRPPLRLLLDRLAPGAEFTAVHCTHSQAEDLDRLVEGGANICICPLTEANLADGIPPRRVSDAGVPLSLGTDSNLRIDFTEEMRLLEHAHRLREQRRGVFTASDGSVARRLFEIATDGGARSLGLRAGRIEPGYLADFFTIDLGSPLLAEASREELLASFVFGGDPRVVRRVAVGGKELD